MFVFTVLVDCMLASAVGAAGCVVPGAGQEVDRPDRKLGTVVLADAGTGMGACRSHNCCVLVLAGANLLAAATALDEALLLSPTGMLVVKGSRVLELADAAGAGAAGDGSCW